MRTSFAPQISMRGGCGGGGGAGGGGAAASPSPPRVRVFGESISRLVGKEDREEWEEDSKDSGEESEEDSLPHLLLQSAVLYLEPYASVNAKTRVNITLYIRADQNEKECLCRTHDYL